MVYWQSKAGKIIKKSHCPDYDVSVKKIKVINVALSKLKMDCRYFKMLVIFCQFLSTVSALENDCCHIFKQCHLLP